MPAVIKDTAIALDITSALTDTDGSEALSVVVSGLPTGAVLSSGTDNGNGSWTLASGDLSGLTITPPSGDDADFTLTVTATATDGTDTASTAGTIDVTVTEASGPSGQSFIGDSGGNTLNGDSDGNLINGLGGDDDLYGNGGDDLMLGGSGSDFMEGGDGNDELRGEDGDDGMNGNAGNDILLGGAGNESFITGGAGDDVIEGGSGDDYFLSGGTGNDVFVFKPDFGYDTIVDFEAGAGTDDVLKLEGLGVSTFADLLAISIQQSDGTLVEVDADNSVLLEGVNKDRPARRRLASRLN